jgi:hypothetical protein
MTMYRAAILSGFMLLSLDAALAHAEASAARPTEASSGSAGADESERDRGLGFQFAGGIAPYYAALLKIPDVEDVWALSLVAGISYGPSRHFELRALPFISFGNSPMGNNDRWFEAGGQLVGKYNWNTWLSSELGVRGGAISLPVYHEVQGVGATPPPPSWWTYRTKLVGAVGPYLSLLQLRGLEISGFPMELGLWSALLMPVTGSKDPVLQLGIWFAYVAG